MCDGQKFKFKDWAETASYLVQVLGIIGALYVYYTWEVERGDHAVDFIFKLDEKFNSDDVKAGRNLIDWDEEYCEIKDRMEELSDRHREIQEIYERRQWEQQPDSSAKQAWLNHRKEVDDKIKNVDAMLQFYETVNAARVEKQAPVAWLSLRYSYWLDYYYSDERKEYRHYIDHYFPDLSRWLNEDLTQPKENRYFSVHFAKSSWRPVVAIFPELQTTGFLWNKNVELIIKGSAATGKAAAGYESHDISFTNKIPVTNNVFITNIVYKINAEPWITNIYTNSTPWTNNVTIGWLVTNHIPIMCDSNFTISAYAVDNRGTNSFTNTMSFRYTETSGLEWDGTR